MSMMLPRSLRCTGRRRWRGRWRRVGDKLPVAVDYTVAAVIGGRSRRVGRAGLRIGARRSQAKGQTAQQRYGQAANVPHGTPYSRTHSHSANSLKTVPRQSRRGRALGLITGHSLEPCAIGFVTTQLLRITAFGGMCRSRRLAVAGAVSGSCQIRAKPLKCSAA